MKLVKLLMAGFVSLFLCLSVSQAVLAQTFSKPGESVTLEVPDTSITIDGYAAPGALVTVREGGVVVGTAIADASGYYTITLSSQSTGIHTLAVSFEDADGNVSPESIVSLSVSTQQDTKETVVLAPTIQTVGDTTVEQGESVVINGYTTPGAQVVLTISPSGKQINVTADAGGRYEYSVNTSDFTLGQFDGSVTALIGAEITTASKTVQFTVEPATAPIIPDIVVDGQQLPPPIPVTPGDGSSITGDSVTVSGESVPNAQIFIYENGIVIGSIFADEFGSWSFEYQATSSPVTLSFEACIDDRCSVLSTTITLTFLGLPADAPFCSTEFRLRNYRFWDERTGDPVDLELIGSSDTSAEDFRGTYRIDWGDGDIEVFSHDVTNNTIWEHRYQQTGRYNGVVTHFLDGLSDDSDASCRFTRYFTVHVVLESSTRPIVNVTYLLATLAVLTGGVELFYRRKKHNA